LDFLSSLNSRQRDAVTHTEGPLLVLAGAGSGKTRVLAHRIAYILSSGRTRPGGVLAVTFTNKAAGEMAERVRGLVGSMFTGIWLGTFHAICARILRFEGRALGISSDFTIYDDQDQTLLVKQVIADLGLAQSKIAPRAALARISWAKSSLLTAEEFAGMAASPYDRKIASIYLSYDSALRASNALDFDDLISIPVRLFKASPDAYERNSGRFRYVLIDEYQDTNRAQYELVRLLSSTHRNICVVGDDDQSIYRWRGADVSNILNFERDFPDARVIRLEQSYRSTKTILAVSQSVISRNTRRKAKSLWTENPVGRKIVVSGVMSEQDEGEYLAETVSRMSGGDGRRLADFVILYRTNAQSRPIEDALRRRGIPYVIVGGTRFYERREIKDVVAYLRVLVNPSDSVSLMRIINVPPRGIGDVTVGRLKRFAAEHGLSLWSALERFEEIDDIGPGPVKKLQGFTTMIGDLKAVAGAGRVADLISTVAERTGYLRHLGEQATVDAVSRTENIQELVAGGHEFEERAEQPTLEKFLEEVALVSDIDLWDDRKDAVSLMTLHNAKGLEFPLVMIAGVEEGLIPHHTSFEDQEELEEERRLFYVGLTRAKERAFLSFASGRRGFQGWMPQVTSRFLEDIPEEYLEVFGPPGGEGDDSPARPRQRPEYEDWGEEKVVRAGMRVGHPDWGTGVVRRCEGCGRQMRLTIEFTGGLVKRVMARYANLEILDDY
jgi:DNA helicase-2/ATP-dependent DNA helicase PcrA